MNRVGSAVAVGVVAGLATGIAAGLSASQAIAGFMAFLGATGLALAILKETGR
ncbi:hypothetical protein [Actinomadura sp. KC06]|uniref:hypothetical protein n=1 Tax=Actinomadura sp. KC06 TaxID=2530369 RepID=UPI001404AE8E|nr:hypothetical protein [Actinomadura sp. KC06]